MSIPGTSWRILAQPVDNTEGRDIDIRSTDQPRSTILDEVVLDEWFHLEQMDDRSWWMRIGPYAVNVTVDKNGEVKSVMWEDEGHEDGIESSTGGGATIWKRAKK